MQIEAFNACILSIYVKKYMAISNLPQARPQEIVRYVYIYHKS